MFELYDYHFFVLEQMIENRKDAGKQANPPSCELSSGVSRQMLKPRGQQTTKRAFRDALKRACLCEEKGDIKTSEWIECLKAGETAQIIERNLDLEPGSFTKEKWKERGKH